MAEAVSGKFISSSGGSDPEEATLALASTGCLGTARLHSLATLGRALPLPVSSLLRLQWTGRACPGEASAVVATCAPRSQWHHRHTGVRNAFKSLAALLPAQAFSREKG